MGIPSEPPALNEAPFAFFMPQDFDIDIGSFDPVQLQQQFEQFMIQNPAAFEQMQSEMEAMDAYEDALNAQYDDEEEDDEDDQDEEEEEDEEDYDDIDNPKLQLTFGSGSGLDSGFTIDA